MASTLLPTVGVPGAQVVGIGQRKSLSGLSLAETGSIAGETFTVTLADNFGLFYATGTGVTGSGTNLLTLTGTLAQITAALATLSVLEGKAGSDTITVTAVDSLGNKATNQTIAMTTNGAPVMSAPASVVDPYAQTKAISGVALTETGNTTGETFTVTLSDTNGALTASGTGVTGSGLHNMTITGTLAQVNAALATLAETNSTAGSDTITINVKDSLGNVAATQTIGVTVTGRPVLTVPGTQAIGVGLPASISGVGVTEVNAVAGEIFTVTLTANRGTLSATGAGVSGNGTAALTVVGTLAQVNAALATLTTTNSVVNSASIAIAVTDSFGNTAIGKSVSVGVSGVPALTGAGSETLGLNVPKAITGLGLGEPGNATGETFTVTVGDTNGILTAGGSGVTGSGTTELVISGSLAQVNAALATVSETSATAGSDPITINAVDSFGNAAPTKTVAITVNGTPVITAPTVWTTAMAQATPLTGIGVTESGNASGATFTVTLTDTTGLLSVTGTGATGSGTNSLTLTGSLAQVDGDLSTLKDLEAAVGTDTITVTASDSFGNSAVSQVVMVTTSDEPVTVTTSSSSSAPTATIISAPVIPQPANPGDVVGLVLQNTQTTTLAPRYVTFEEEFSDGQVPAGDHLVATINGVQEAVQMDVQTSNADGSVKTALITLQQPSLAPNSSTGVMLSLASSAATQPSLNIGNAVFNTTIALNLHGTSGSTLYNINVDQALQQALASGNVSYWQQGPLATQVRINVPIAGSLHVQMDLTLFADGSTSADVEFDNDLAMGSTGGTVNYDVTITQNGTVALQQSNLTQYQYQTWDTTLYSNGAPQVNIQHDIAALEATGMIQNYDLSLGVNSTVISNESASLAANAAKFGILGTGDYTTYMGTTGGRPDIGPAPTWDVAWLMTQNAAAATYALDMADLAGSIPWHMVSASTGNYLMSTTNPNLWVDPRGGPATGTAGLTQQPDDFSSQSSPGNGWAPDAAHEPDTDYIAYLMTGNRYYLDQLNAEASWDVLSATPSARENGQGIVANTTVQVRAQAWSLREIVEAAAANPDGSAEKAYFTQIMNNNFTYLLNEAQTSNEGQASGWIIGNSGTTVAPWQQDYFATTVIEAAQMGSQPAQQLLAWETNFLAGLFTSGAEGFDPYTGATYQINAFSASGTPYQTWAQIEAETQLNGGAQYVTPGSWAPLAYGAYQDEALGVLAGDITVTGSTDAMKAYGWLVAHTQVTTAWEESNLQWDIAPRLPDGNLLSSNEVQISHSVVGGSMTLIGGSGDNLLYAGMGTDILQGGTGLNLMFANGGNDTLIGGPNGNYMFSGAGNNTFVEGQGYNYMEASGAGAVEFVLAVNNAATDMINDFAIGTDFLHVVDGEGNPLSSGAISALISGATTSSSGDAVLTLAPGHTVTLHGINTGQLSSTMFN